MFQDWKWIDGSQENTHHLLCVQCGHDDKIQVRETYEDPLTSCSVLRWQW